MSLYFDNNKLFDAEGHLTDEGLYAIKDGTLDDLGAGKIPMRRRRPSATAGSTRAIWAMCRRMISSTYWGASRAC